jgi:outer membrane protein
MKKTLLSLALLATGVASYAQLAQGTMMLGGGIGFSSSGGTTETTGATGAAAVLNTSITAPATSSFSISPTFGYFMSENMAVGGSLNFGSTTTTDKRVFNSSTGATRSDDGSTLGAKEAKYDKVNKSSGFGISLFANKYTGINEKWYWYMGGTLGFNSASGTSTSVVSDFAAPPTWSTKEIAAPTTTTISLGANLGVLYKLNDSWGFQAGLNNIFGFTYAMGSSTVENGGIFGSTKTSTSDMNLNVGTGSFGLGAVTFGAFYFIK